MVLKYVIKIWDWEVFLRFDESLVCLVVGGGGYIFVDYMVYE